MVRFILKIKNLFSFLFKKESKQVNPRMYVIVRNDLSSIYKMVQGSHALSQLALDYSEVFKTWNNQYVIYLQVYNGQRLKQLYTTLKDKNLLVSQFIEPDMESDLPTALAIYEPGDGIIYNELKHLDLAK